METLTYSALQESIVPKLRELALKSTCKRSKCAAIIVMILPNGTSLFIGEGYNSKPCNEIGECTKDNLPTGFKSDRTCCVHAEQRAILDAYNRIGKSGIQDSSLYFLRLDDNDNPIYAGMPYCTICSKMALDAGVKYFLLYKKDGWARYDTKEYNDLSFAFNPDYDEMSNYDAYIYQLEWHIKQPPLYFLAKRKSQIIKYMTSLHGIGIEKDFDVYVTIHDTKEMNSRGLMYTNIKTHE